MSSFNFFLFNLIHNLSGWNFLLDGLGVFLAKYLSYFLVLGVLFLIFKENGWKRRLLFFGESALAVILSRGLLTEIIRFFYEHPRPFDILHFTPLIPESGNSFPSGHMTFYFALAMIVFYWNRKWGIWYFALASLIGLARIFVGVHWPLDILGGIIIGILSGIFIHWLLSSYSEKIKESSLHSFPQ